MWGEYVLDFWEGKVDYSLFSEVIDLFVKMCVCMCKCYVIKIWFMFVVLVLERLR